MQNESMDVLAHGLWGGAIFGQKARGQWKWGFLLGISPDILAFGPAFVSRALTGTLGAWATPGPPPLSSFPSYVFDLYNITHSLVVWAIVVLALRYRNGVFPWVLGAWGLHILCDIPLHSIRFFPTPFLWPFPTPFVDGIRWAQAPIVLTNYSLIISTYTVLTYLRFRRKRSVLTLRSDPQGRG
jgi:hypothetical protein